MNRYLSILSILLVVLLAACTAFELDEPVSYGDDVLKLRSSVVRLTEAPTKAITDEEAEGKDSRYENNLGKTLDVFAQGVSDPDFWKEYHISSSADYTSATEQFLANNWKSEGFKIGDSYNIYVVANSTETNNTVGSLSALNSLEHTDTDIYKVYSTDNNELDYSAAYTSSKSFMMDGFLENWTPDADSKTQCFDVINMERAAAKIIVDVSFSNEFLATLADEGVGEPMFKYVNFATTSSVVRGGSVDNPDLATGSWTKMSSWSASNTTGGLITYSYGFSWTAETIMTEAPYILLSFPLTKKGETESAFNYYRIPVCPESSLTLERNHIYKVSATINSFGSSKLIEVDQDVTLDYEVLSWTEETSEVTNVVAEKLYYFFVSPTEVVLRGNGTQETVFTYYAPSELTVYKTTIPQAALTSNSGVSYEAFYYNSNGEAVEVTGDYTITKDSDTKSYSVSSTVLENHAVKYIRFRLYVEYEDDNGVTQTLQQDIYITHYPLDNIQSIAGDWSSKFTSASTTITREYSYDPEGDGWSGWDGSEWVTEAPDSGNFEYRTGEPEEITQAEWAAGIGSSNDDRKNANSLEDAVNGYYATGGAAGTKTLRHYTNIGILGSYKVITAINSYSWNGTEVSVEFTFTTWYGQPDTASESFSGFDYISDYTDTGTNTVTLNTWKYDKYYKVETEYKRYYRDVATSYITSNWVMWDEHSTGYHTGVKTTYDSYFDAKKYYNNQYCAPIVEVQEKRNSNNYKAQVVSRNNDGYFYYGTATRTNNNGYNYTGYGNFSNLTNNRMYVLQITSTSDSYVIGKPTLDANNQSDDNVLYPAIQIASQLGAVSTGMDDEEAATHCAQYMEVDENGKKFIGWRLPTDAEIQVIIAYQYDSKNADIITEVLGGEYYYNLAGGRSYNSQGDQDNDSYTYVRCIREMSETDLDYLEGRLTGTELTNYINN